MSVCLYVRKRTPHELVRVGETKELEAWDGRERFVPPELCLRRRKFRQNLSGPTTKKTLFLCVSSLRVRHENQHNNLNKIKNCITDAYIIIWGIVYFDKFVPLKSFLL